MGLMQHLIYAPTSPCCRRSESGGDDVTIGGGRTKHRPLLRPNRQSRELAFAPAAPKPSSSSPKSTRRYSRSRECQFHVKIRLRTEALLEATIVRQNRR